MVAFSAEIRTAVAAESYFDQIEERYWRCAELKASGVECDDASIAGNVPLKIATVLQIGLRRALRLTESFVADVNAGCFAASIESAEALLETASLLKECQLRVEKIALGKDIRMITALEELGMDAFIRSESPAWKLPARHAVPDLNPSLITDRATLESVKTAVCIVALGLLITITAIERYSGVQTGFVRLWEDLQAKCHGRCNN
jgi:hypothetical protein